MRALSARLLRHLPEVAFGFGLVLAFLAIVIDPVAAAPVRVDLSIRYSRFEPAALTVSSGRPVTFVIRNFDPIDHEWIVGDAQLHARHRLGTEPYHDTRPTEISIGALSTVETTVVFAEPVTWTYICHLPGHEAYGMVGVIEVR